VLAATPRQLQSRWTCWPPWAGFEIATLVGVVLQAAQERRVIVVDGFIASAAVLVASGWRRMCCSAACLPTARANAATPAMLVHLGAGASPLLDLGLRLGEGSGAALAWPLLVGLRHPARDGEL
jgi:nicotinate-nucleotide--dimethylbenzimidazole phosphoribosyltransferase